MKDEEEILREFFSIQKEITTALSKGRIKRNIAFIDEYDIVGTNSFNGTKLCLKLNVAKKLFRMGVVLFDRGFSKNS